MSRILYERRCRCKEEFSRTRNSITRSEGRPLRYPNSMKIDIRSKTFQIKYKKRLSVTAKLIFNSFQNKYIYYAIDDILYSLKSNTRERENLLAILYSPVLWLHNNFSVNFFDIWIGEIYIQEISKVNKFLEIESQTSEQFNSMTLKLFYKVPITTKKQEPLW
jgi:hypothetical protein